MFCPTGDFDVPMSIVHTIRATPPLRNFGQIAKVVVAKVVVIDESGRYTSAMQIWMTGYRKTRKEQIYVWRI